MWRTWINAIIGVWIIIVSFVPGLRSFVPLLITGIVVLILGVWGGRCRSKSA